MGATGDDAGEQQPDDVAGRPRHRAAGSLLAAAMFGLDQALGRKPREEAPVIVDANGDPVDIDSDGISVMLDDWTSAVAPPQPRSAPLTPRGGAGRRRSSRWR